MATWAATAKATATVTHKRLTVTEYRSSKMVDAANFEACDGSGSNGGSGGGGGGSSRKDGVDNDDVDNDGEDRGRQCRPLQ